MFKSDPKVIIKKQALQKISTNNLISHDYGRYCDAIANKGIRSWDGWIHPSSLNVNSKVETQLKKLSKETKMPPAAIKRMQVGEALHNHWQSLMEKSFFVKGKCHTEEHIEIPKLLFRGTPDQWGTHPFVGNVLMEYKSFSSYRRDKKQGEKFMEWVKDDTPSQIQKIMFDRLATFYDFKDRPEIDHMTQAFIYTWAIYKKYGILMDWVCIAYLRKDNLDVVEFWYSVKKEKEFMEKCINNYKDVFKEVKILGKQKRKEFKEETKRRAS